MNFVCGDFVEDTWSRLPAPRPLRRHRPCEKAVIVTIGRFGLFTEDQARTKAQSILQQMRDGIDPHDVKRQDEAMKVTLRTVADSYFARPGKLKEATRKEMDRHIKTVLAAWEHKPIVAITEDDVQKRYHEMTTKGMRGKPAIGSANLFMTTLRTLINYAARQYKRSDGSPLITHNPVDALGDDWIQLKPRTRDIDAGKVGEVWHMLTTLRAELIAAQQREDSKINPHDPDRQSGVDLVMFLLMTRARRNEGAMLTWDRVNLDEGWFHLPDPKNANPVWIPLSSQTKACSLPANGSTPIPMSSLRGARRGISPIHAHRSNGSARSWANSYLRMTCRARWSQ
jgi:integrase